MFNLKTEDFIESRPLETRIWRYINHEKFIDLINTSELFFCQAKKLADKYEGSFELADLGLVEGTDLEQALIDGYNAPNWMRAHTAVNCWHINEQESIAMWDLYLKNPFNNMSKPKISPSTSDTYDIPYSGVAIQSTVGKLLESLQNAETFGSLTSGAITYSKLERPQPGYGCATGTDIFFRKKPEYKYENEYRVILQGCNLQKIHLLGGVRVPINLSHLIEKIYIAPKQPEFTRSIIERLLEKNGLHIPLVSSQVYSKPKY